MKSVKAIIANALSAGQTTLSEYDSKMILTEYGIPTTQEMLIEDSEKAEAAADQIGYPIVLKVCAAEAAHKTEQGLIELGIKDTVELKRAYDRLAPKARDLGGAILVQGKVQAFALGELLNESTVVIHIEKANPEFKGIYVKMTQGYTERWEDVTTYANLEQDLGEPGLRRAKKSYYPDHLQEKFEITLA